MSSQSDAFLVPDEDGSAAATRTRVVRRLFNPFAHSSSRLSTHPLFPLMALSAPSRAFPTGSRPRQLFPCNNDVGGKSCSPSVPPDVRARHRRGAAGRANHLPQPLHRPRHSVADLLGSVQSSSTTCIGAVPCERVGASTSDSVSRSVPAATPRGSIRSEPARGLEQYKARNGSVFLRGPSGIGGASATSSKHKAMAPSVHIRYGKLKLSKMYIGLWEGKKEGFICVSSLLLCAFPCLATYEVLGFFVFNSGRHRV